jgi:hypothetical protein
VAAGGKQRNCNNNVKTARRPSLLARRFRSVHQPFKLVKFRVPISQKLIYTKKPKNRRVAKIE